MKTYGGVDILIQVFLTSWREMDSFTIRSLYLRYPLDRRLGGCQNRSIESVNYCNNGNDTVSYKLKEIDTLACESDVVEEGTALGGRTSLSLSLSLSRVLPLTAARRRVFCELKQVDFYWRQQCRQVQVMLLKRRDSFIFRYPKPVVLLM
jgi:hypothetical protein